MSPPPPLAPGFEPADAGRLLASLRCLARVDLEGPGLRLALPDLNALLRRPAPPLLAALAARALAPPARGRARAGGRAGAGVGPRRPPRLGRPARPRRLPRGPPAPPAPPVGSDGLAAAAQVLVVTGQGTVAGADLAAFVTGGGPAGRRLRELDLGEGVLLHCCDGSSVDLAALGERHGRARERLGLPRTLGGPSRTPFHLVQLLARAPRLRRLRASLEGGGDGSEAGPHWLSEHCSHLEALEVRRACNVSPEDIAVYLSRARAVRRLHLSINVQGAAAVRSYHASFALLSSLRPDVKVTRSALATGSALAAAAVGVDSGSLQVVVSLGLP
eukprot:tig00021037_g17423.t1